MDSLSAKIIFRYLELVHPIWHKTHFKIRWIYISIAVTWILGITINFAYHIPTTKVKHLSFIIFLLSVLYLLNNNYKDENKVKTIKRSKELEIMLEGVVKNDK